MATQNILCTVVGLQDHPVAATAPATGQLLTWNGSAWQPGGNADVTGSLTVTGTTTLGNTATTQTIMPATNNTYTLGGAGNYWASVTAQTVTQVSDPRLKKDIQKIPGALALVMSIPPKTYHFLKEPSDAPLHWGFLTTDVQEAMGKNFAGVQTGDDPDHTQTLAYTEMIAVLWRAVQELSDEVAELHDRMRVIRSAQSN